MASVVREFFGFGGGGSSEKSRSRSRSPKPRSPAGPEGGPSPSGGPKERPLFTTKDIGSDYYQVLREKKRPPVCKLLWVLVTIGAIAFCSFLVYKLLNSYFKYESFVVVKTKYKKQLTLPAVTICSTNLMNYTRMKENLDPDIITAMNSLMVKVDTHTGEKVHDIDFEDEAAVIQASKDEDGEETNFFEDYGMSVYNFDLGYEDYEYKFAGNQVMLYKEFVEGAFDPLDQASQLGYCLQLNDDQKWVQSTNGYQGGFVIDLNANMDTYLPASSTAGFQIFIRNPDETVMLKDTGYHIAPGSEVFMKLKKKAIHRLKHPYGKCLTRAAEFPTNKTTTGTVRECKEEKFIKLMVEECDCLPWYLITRVVHYNTTDPVKGQVVYKKWVDYLNSTTNISSALDNIQCSWAVEQICNNIVQTRLNLNASKTSGNDDDLDEWDSCEESCIYNSYDVEITTSVFPSSHVYHETFMKEQMYDDMNKTFEFARENFVRLHIFYGDLIETTETQTAAYEIQNFIAEFGGTVDSIVGISFFTCFQFLEICMGMFWNRRRGREG